jgi:hypothetical protein
MTLNWRVLSILGSVLLVTLIAGLGVPLLSQSTVKSQSTRLPYTATFVETVTANGTSGTAAHYTFAMRSDGSTVQRVGTASRGGRTLFFATGVRVVTDDAQRRKSSEPGELSPQWRRPQNHCALGDIFVGEEVVNGLRAAKVTGRSDRTRTEWFALDMDCASLGSQLDYPDGQRSRTELVSFTRGEPDPALFDVPVDYVEGPPSSLLPPGLVQSEQTKGIFEVRDKQYVARRQK